MIQNFLLVPFPVPNDLVFLGTNVFAQAYLNNLNGSPQLANAWDLILGY